MPEKSSVTVLKPDEGIFGLPPLNNLYVSKHVVVESMPVAEITPCEPDFSAGMTLFKLNPARGKYDIILKNLGFKAPDSIRVAFLADNFPTDTFSNDYSETFLQAATDIGAQKIQEIIQMTGKDTLSAATGKIADITKSIGEKTGGPVGTTLGIFGSMTKTGGEAIKSLEAVPGLGTVSKMLAGHRIDFPNIWRNSGFSPSYTMTVRLFNPCPGNIESTNHHIIGPLAVLLSLGMPRTKDGHTYKWPFFHKIKCPGIYNLDPAVISNMTVIKGGDQQQIGWNQRLGIVDVRIDFTSLYTSMITEESDVTITGRPTLSGYLKVLKEEGKDVKDHYKKAGDMSGVISEETVETKDRSVKVKERSTERITTSEELSPRVSTDAKKISTDLLDKNSINKALREVYNQF